jgi:hypothetical protein
MNHVRRTPLMLEGPVPVGCRVGYSFCPMPQACPDRLGCYRRFRWVKSHRRHENVWKLDLEADAVESGSAFLASEMCELEPRSESLTRSLLKEIGGKGMGEGILNCFALLSSFIQWSAFWALLPRSAARKCCLRDHGVSLWGVLRLCMEFFLISPSYKYVMH